MRGWSNPTAGGMTPAGERTPIRRFFLRRTVNLAIARIGTIWGLSFSGVGLAEKPVVLVSAPAVRLMAEEVAGDVADVRSVLAEGRSVHDFEPSPKDVRTMRRANLIVYIDDLTDGWMFRSAGKKIPRFALLPTVNPMPYGETIGKDALGPSAAKSMAKQLDPHFWLDPARMGMAAEQLADQIARQLNLNEANAKAILSRATAFKQRMADLEKYLLQTVKDWPQTSVILAHGSIGYFARLTGLKVVGVLEPVPHVEPTPRQMKALIATAKANKPCVVLAEEQIDAAASRALGREAGLRIVRIDPLGTSTPIAKGSRYDDLLKAFIAEVARGVVAK